MRQTRLIGSAAAAPITDTAVRRITCNPDCTSYLFADRNSNDASDGCAYIYPDHASHFYADDYSDDGHDALVYSDPNGNPNRLTVLGKGQQG